MHVFLFVKDATQGATSSEIDNETHTAERLGKLTNRLNRRLTTLARWSDNPVFDRETADMRATQQAETRGEEGASDGGALFSEDSVHVPRSTLLGHSSSSNGITAPSSSSSGSKAVNNRRSTGGTGVKSSGGGVSTGASRMPQGQGRGLAQRSMNGRNGRVPTGHSNSLADTAG